MRFEWDKNKSSTNYAKHSVEFVYATNVFLDKNAHISRDVRQNYDKKRWNIIGFIEAKLFVVTYTQRKGKIRIISARIRGKREQKKYGSI